MKIQKLPEETISKLKSGIIIVDAIQCVLELVYNALDAAATSVVVQIDLKNYKIQVTDNGFGISLDDLKCVGKRYMTSKFDSLQNNENSFHTYGFKGQALASMLDVCKSMTIKTRCQDNNFTLIKTLQNNKTQPIKKKKVKEDEPGTSVIIEDFMCNMPVRRKRIDEIFDIEEMKSQLKFLAIIHYNVSFTLRNENKCLILLQTQKTFNALSTIEEFCGASFCKSLKYISYQENNYKIVGYISSKPQSQNKIQLFYVNKRIIAKGMIHKIVSDIMNKYIKKKNISSDSPIKQNLVLKHFQQYSASFILELQCSVYCYELFTNVRQCTVEFKKWKEVLKCIHKAIKKAFHFNQVNSSNSSNSSTTTSKKESSNEQKKISRKCGTSALINAVKGFPVKRTDMDTEANNYINKLNSDDVKKFDSSLNKIRCENNDCKQKRKPQKTPKQPKHNVIAFHKRLNCLTNDSLESPIPKKKIKTCMDSNANFNFQSHCLDQFCNWLKTNKKAFNLLKSFFLCNSSYSNAEIQNSKLSIRKNLTSENATWKQKYIDINEKGVNFTKNLTNITTPELQKTSKIFNSTQKEEKEIFQREHLSVALSNKNYSKNLDVFEKEKINTDYNYFQQNNIEHSRSLGSFQQTNYTQNLGFIETPAMSDLIFNNIINLRNLSSKVDRQIIYESKSILKDKYTTSFSNTWKSHYKDLLSPSELLHELWQNKKFSDNQSYDLIIDNENFDSQSEIKKHQENTCHLKNFSYVSQFITKPKGQDVQVQVSLEEINGLKKVDAIVQTNITVNDNFSKWDFVTLNSPVFKNAIQVSPKNCSSENFIIAKDEVSNQSLNSNIEKFIHANFWISCTLEDSKNVDPGSENQTVSINSITKDKFSTSSDFIYSTQNINVIQKGQNESNVLQENSACVENSAKNSVKIIVPVNNCSLNTTQSLSTIPAEKLNNETLNQSNFHVTERYNFVPKGLSQTVINNADPVTIHLSSHGKDQIKSTIESSKNELLLSIKWQDDHTGQSLKPTLLNGLLDEIKKKRKETSSYWESEILNASLSCCAIKIHDLLHSFTFTKELLSKVEIIGQLDQKFIVAKIMISEPKEMELISLFDQHAVDERIKLEKLIQDYVSADGALISSNLNPKLECRLSKSLVQTITKLREKLLQFGLSWKLVDETTILIETLPTFVLDKHSKDKSKKYTSIDCDIQALIINILEELSETRGIISKIPKKVHNALCLEACHKAIKFNKALTKEEMVLMIKQLATCKLPFQCAHGRPSVIPIIDLKDFKFGEETTKPVDIKNVKKFINLKN